MFLQRTSARLARGWRVPLTRSLSTGDNGGDDAPKAVNPAKALRAKLKAEAERYNREREEYRAKMKELRKQFALEHEEKEREREQVRLKKIERGEKLRKLMEEEEKRLKAQYESQRTWLELDPIEALKETPEQRVQRLKEQREEKMRRRQYVLEKLQEERLVREKEKEVYVEFLAREAKGWITQHDVEEGTLEEKLKTKLMAVQPVTASWANDLPSHHFEEAWRFLSDDTSHIFREVKNHNQN